MSEVNLQVGGRARVILREGQDCIEEASLTAGKDDFGTSCLDHDKDYYFPA